MNYMLTSGIAGRQNIEFALERYKRLLTDKLGKEVGEIVYRSTGGMDSVDRLWELERLYSGRSQEDIDRERSGK